MHGLRDCGAAIPGVDPAGVRYVRSSSPPVATACQGGRRPEETALTNFTAEMMHELNLLAMFDLSSMQSGVKIHGTAAPDTIAADRRPIRNSYRERAPRRSGRHRRRACGP